MKDCKSFIPQFKAVDDDGTASWVMATLNVIDDDGDVTLPGAFGKQSFAIVPAHDHTHVPLGKAVLREEGDEAIVDAKFNLDIPAAKDWHSAIKFDLANPPAVQEYSYAYNLHDGGWKMGTFKGERVRFFHPKADGTPGVDVYESSPVLRGAGNFTRTLSAKSGMKFDEHADSVLAEVGALIERFPEVIAFRTERGKSRLSEHSVELLARVEAELKRLLAFREPAPDTTTTDDVASEFARFVALTSQGVHQ